MVIVCLVQVSEEVKLLICLQKICNSFSRCSCVYWLLCVCVMFIVCSSVVLVVVLLFCVNISMKLRVVCSFCLVVVLKQFSLSSLVVCVYQIWYLVSSELCRNSGVVVVVSGSVSFGLFCGLKFYFRVVWILLSWCFSCVDCLNILFGVLFSCFSMCRQKVVCCCWMRWVCVLLCSVICFLVQVWVIFSRWQMLFVLLVLIVISFFIVSWFSVVVVVVVLILVLVIMVVVVFSENGLIKVVS